MCPVPKELTLTCVVDAYRSGWTVVEFLAHRFTYHTADVWRERVERESVRVNDGIVGPDATIRKDDRVQYTIFHAEPDVDFAYDVLYEDDAILAVSKSGNIPVHACGIYITHTLIARLREDYGPDIRLGHRLDRETSGVVLICKNKDTARGLSMQFERGEVGKSYVAIVQGEVSEDTFEVDAPIGRIDQREAYPEIYAHARARNMAFYLPKSIVDLENGKPSRTRFRVTQRLEGFTVLEAIPTTGRTNQIRIHAAHAGYPIVGDKTYSLSGDIRDECLKEGMTDRVRETLILERHALHCQALEFKQPITGADLRIESGLPADLLGFLHKAREGVEISTSPTSHKRKAPQTI